MNNDLISREALKEITYINKGNFNTVEGIREWIDNAPTVEIPIARWDAYCEGQKVGYEKGYQEGHIEGVLQGEKLYARPQGTWKLIKDKGNNVNAECPFCKFEIKSIAYNFSVWEVIQFIKNNDFDYKFPNFCENCGADMRKGGAEE